MQLPKAMILEPIEDTYININADLNGASPTLRLYTWPDRMVANAILMKFDSKAFSPTMRMLKATLRLHLVDADNAPERDYYVSAHRLLKPADLAKATGFVYDGVNTWTANDCCRGGTPMAQADISVLYNTQAIDKTLGPKEWDITWIAFAWKKPNLNFGLLLNSDASKGKDRFRYFASKEHPDQTIRPKLVIRYIEEDENWIKP